MPLLRPCAHRGCRRLLPHGTTRCPDHQLEPRGWRHQQARKLVLADATRCATCGCLPTPGNELTLGHIVARAAGGGLARANLRAECKKCNYSRGAS